MNANALLIEEAEKRCLDLKGGQTWAGVCSNYIFICKKHGEYKQRFNHHQAGSSCPRCGGVAHFTIEEAEKEFPDLKRGQIWKNNKTKYYFICPKGHPDYFQGYGNHRIGRRCPRCHDSRGEARIAAYLKNAYATILFKQQMWFSDCRNKKPLPFDFCFNSERILIEYHGEQHYRPMRYSNAIRKFESVQRHDRIKKNWARRNGWNLIIVSYRIKDIELYLDRRLRKIVERHAPSKER
jgi:hypothetical protein